MIRKADEIRIGSQDEGHLAAGTGTWGKMCEAKREGIVVGGPVVIATRWRFGVVRGSMFSDQSHKLPLLPGQPGLLSRHDSAMIV